MEQTFGNFGAAVPIGESSPPPGQFPPTQHQSPLQTVAPGYMQSAPMGGQSQAHMGAQHIQSSPANVRPFCF